MEEQRRRIRRDDWRLLVVLDACRFDAFERLHGDHLDGRLRPVRSAVDPRRDVATASWARETFVDAMDDTVYVSASPVVNSHRSVGGFAGRAHFEDVVDVWDRGWDDALETVPPDRVSRAARQALQSHPGRRVIAHYIQPHAPYIAAGGSSTAPARSPDDATAVGRWLKHVVGGRLRRVVGGRTTRWLLRATGSPPPSCIHEAQRRLGAEGLRRAYDRDLTMALESVADLAENCDGRVVVTADHGEALGERGFFGHSYLPPMDVLTTVPWFVVDDPAHPGVHPA